MANLAATSDFLPTASLATLRLRAAVLRRVREFFDARGYWEVQTPLLSHDGPADAHLIAFETQWWPGGIPPAPSKPHDPENTLYLQTSPEFAMKRLLAAGADAIYQLGSAFRNGEAGQLHNPEFTMLEWYRVGDSFENQCLLVEELVRAVFAAVPSPHSQGLNRNKGDDSVQVLRPQSFRCTTYQQAFREQLQIEVFEIPTADLPAVAAARHVPLPPGLAIDDRDGWLNLLLAECIEPYLGKDHPEFLHDYPASQAALARVRPGPPAVAERFELYFQGVELCNGYVELTQPEVLEARLAADSHRRTAEGLPPLAQHSRLLAAMRHGIPESVGVALGFDRLLMLARGAKSIAEVIPFPFDRA